MPRPTPCGSWPSPITSDLIVTGTIGLGSVALAGQDVLWLELRPTEGGRATLVRRGTDGVARELTPAPWNVRTRVHEYGGGAYAVDGQTVVFSHFPDQRLYVLEPGAEPRPLTEPGRRYADAAFDRGRGALVCVEEDHTAPGEAVNRVVALDLQDGSRRVLAEGADFYASPRLSPDGAKVAWTSWNHPDMPWDATELWVAHLDRDGGVELQEKVAGGPEESVTEPRWSPDGRTLCFVSDRTGWWNLYRYRTGAVTPLCPRETEFAQPQWVFGLSSYAFAGPDRLICTFSQDGLAHLGLLDLAGDGGLTELESPFSAIDYLQATPTHAVFVGGSPRELDAVVRLDLATGAREVLRRAGDLELDPEVLSTPEPIEFPTEGGEGWTAHGLFYRPKNPAHTVPTGERPPLLVLSHGGPTSSAATSLRLGIQYWTSRGFAVLDVNYGGSSGYGRAYRKRLEGRWGIVDVDDCVAGARWLADRGEVDPARLAIRGGSAGGYTTLAALTFRDAFQAGASHFGVSDLEALAKDTHKFESRYLDRLIGPYPERRDLYVERSPIHATERLACPVILFQGLEDRVVPPNQAERMADALRKKGIPVAYVAFPGEQHGFRKAENIKRSLDGELYFYSRVFGFELAEQVEPVVIENL